jgi:hypothetical protein
MLGAMKGAIDPKKVLVHIYVNECQNRNTQSYHCILATVYRSLYPYIEQNKKRRLIIRVIQKPVSLFCRMWGIVCLLRAVLVAAFVHYSRSSSEQIALEAFYDATNGPSWKTNTGWKAGSNLNDWFGVTATSSTVVTAVVLASNNLAGGCIRIHEPATIPCTFILT